MVWRRSRTGRWVQRGLQSGTGPGLVIIGRAEGAMQRRCGGAGGWCAVGESEVIVAVVLDGQRLHIPGISLGPIGGAGAEYVDEVVGWFVGQQEGGVVELAGERIIEQAQPPAGGSVPSGTACELRGELTVFSLQHGGRLGGEVFGLRGVE